MTKIVCLLGSPREGGNSDKLASVFLDATEAQGAQVSRHALRDMQFCGPTGALPDGGLGPEDDLHAVLQDVMRADVIVFATPIYFCNMTGLMKQAFDRFFAFFVPDYVTAEEPSKLGRQKAFVLIQTQGEGADRYDDLLGQYGPALDKLGLEHRYLVRACGVRALGDMAKQAEVLAEAEALARQLVNPKEP